MQQKELAAFSARRRFEPVTDGPRPLWSVMIPAWNGAEHLVKALDSVLAQDAGRGEMQIEVVDDASDRDNLKGVTRQVAGSRAGYYRQPRNVGPAANFNTCVERSRGRLVHILHGDDTVLPGFYDRLGRALTIEPEAGAAFSRHAIADQDGHWLNLSPLERRQAGLLEKWIERIGVANVMQAPAVVVRRSVYEELGGYHAGLPHAADWDMWKRIAVRYPVWYEPRILACYQVHDGSDSARLARTGANIADARRSIEAARCYLPEAVSLRAKRECARYALEQASRALTSRQFSTGLALVWEALKTDSSPRWVGRASRLLMRSGWRWAVSQ